MAEPTTTTGLFAAAPAVRPPSRLRRLVVLGVAECACLAVSLVGWFLGAAPLTAVEPGDLFVDCGPALFHRPDPLPDALCADAYFPLPAMSLLLIVAGVLGAILCLGLLVRVAVPNGSERR